MEGSLLVILDFGGDGIFYDLFCTVSVENVFLLHRFNTLWSSGKIVSTTFESVFEQIIFANPFFSGLDQNLMLKKMSLFEDVFGGIDVSNPDETIDDEDQPDEAIKKRTARFKRNRSPEAGARNVAQCEYKRRPLFSTQHGLRQIKRKNAEPLEIVVPYARTRRERFYFWPPYSLVSQRNTSNGELKNDSIQKKFL